MTINENTINGKWLEIKGEVQKAWGQLTDDELTQTKGDMNAIGGLIQQKYGNEKETYSAKLSDIFRKIEAKKDAIVDTVKENLKS